MAASKRGGGFLGFLKSEAADQPTTEKIARPRALTASGVRVSHDNARIFGASRKTWALNAWRYRSCVPELRFSTAFIANQVGRVRWFVAEDPGGGKEPVALTAEIDPDSKTPTRVSERTRRIAMEAIERLDLNRRGSSMAGRSAENFEYAGEAYLLGMWNADTGGEEWSIRSVSEVNVSATDGTFRLHEPGRNAEGQTFRYDDPNVALYRLWNPSPEFHAWADAKIEACLGTLHEIHSYDRHKRAVVASRIASGAMLYIPNEINAYTGEAPPDADDPDEDDSDGDDGADPLVEILHEAWATAIRDEESPEALVPVIIRGDAMASDGATPMKDCIGVVPIPRQEIDDIIKKRDAAVTALATGLDFPPERMKGMGESTHWNAAVVSDSEVSNHIEPRCEAFADSLTAAFLRGYLLSHQCPPEEVRWVCVWFDATELSQPADPWGRGKEAHTAGLISDKAARARGDFTEADAPTAMEMLLRHLLAGMPTEQLAAAVELSDLDEEDRIRVKRGIEAANQVAEVRAEAAARAAAPPGLAPRVITPAAPTALPQGPTGTSERPHSTTVPTTTQGPRGAPASAPRVTITAAAGESGEALRWRVDRRLGRDLARVDRELTTRVLAHADATLGRAVERAANRLRSEAVRKPSSPEAAKFPKGSDPRQVISASGRSIAPTVDTDALLDGAFDELETLWNHEVEHAATSVEAIVDRALSTGLAASAALTAAGRAAGLAAAIRARAARAWARFKEKLAEHAIRVLFGEHTPTRDGETSPGLTPVQLVREAVSEVGGSDDEYDQGPLTGPGTGPVVADALRGAGGVTLGHQWEYPAIPRDHFEPHRRLDGVVFTDWDDPQLAVDPADGNWKQTHWRPGDHAGDMCFTSPVVALGITNSSDPYDPQLDQLRADLVAGGLA